MCIPSHIFNAYNAYCKDLWTKSLIMQESSYYTIDPPPFTFALKSKFEDINPMFWLSLNKSTKILGTPSFQINGIFNDIE